MVLKLAVGIMTGSIAVLSDAIDSAEDAIASTFAFLSIRWASQPADEEHPYGHGKAESIAAAGQAVLIAGGAGFIIYQAVPRLIEGDAEIQTTPGLIAMSVTAAVNVCVASVRRAGGEDHGFGRAAGGHAASLDERRAGGGGAAGAGAGRDDRQRDLRPAVRAGAGGVPALDGRAGVPGGGERDHGHEPAGGRAAPD